MQIIALFGPTGVGKTAIAIALAERLREQGEDPVAVSADALQVYAGLEIAHRGGERRPSGPLLEHRLVSFAADRRDASASGRYAQLAHAEIDGLLAAGRRPIVVGGTGLYLRAALTDLDLRPPAPRGVRERLTHELEEHGSPALHARLAEHAPWAAAQHRSERPPAGRARAGAARSRRASTARGPARSCGASELRHPTLLRGPDDGARRRCTRAIDARVDEMVAAGAREEVAARATPPAPRPRRARRSASQSCSRATSRR